MAKKLRGLNGRNPIDFFGFMDGYCSAFEDLPDGAWQAACEGAVEAFNRTYQTKIDPFDGWMAWCNDTAKQQSREGGSK